MRQNPHFWKELRKERKELRTLRQYTDSHTGKYDFERCIAMNDTAINWDEIPDIITKDQLYRICHNIGNPLRFLQQGYCCGTPADIGISLPVYAFRPVKSPLFQGFPATVGRQAGQIIQSPPERVSKCVEKPMRKRRTRRPAGPASGVFSWAVL